MPFWKVPIASVWGVFSSIFMPWRSLWGSKTLWGGFREASRKIIKFWYHIFSDFGEFWRFWGPSGGAPNRPEAPSPEASTISQELPWAPRKHFYRDWRCQTCFFGFSIDFSFIFVFLHIVFLRKFVDQAAWKKQTRKKRKANAGKPSKGKNDRSCSCHLICFNQLQLRCGHWLRQSESATQL